MMNFMKKNVVELSTDLVLLVIMLVNIILTGQNVRWVWSINEYLGVLIGWIVTIPFAHKILKKEMEKNFKKK